MPPVPVGSYPNQNYSQDWELNFCIVLLNYNADTFIRSKLEDYTVIKNSKLQKPLFIMRSLNNLSLNYYLAYSVGESRVNNTTTTENEEFFIHFMKIQAYEQILVGTSWLEMFYWCVCPLINRPRQFSTFL